MQPAPLRSGLPATRPADAWRQPSGPRWRGPAIAAVCVALGAAAVASARGAPAERRPAGPGRFLESLLGRSSEPGLIPAPTPPSTDDIESLRLAALPKFTVTGTAPARPAARVPVAPRVATPPAGVPTWAEARSFARSFDVAIRKVVADAANPAYAPPPPAVVTVAARPGSRPTPALLVTRLQPSGKPAPRSARFDRLRASIARTLATYQRRPLNTAQHTPWEVMHGFIAFGIPTQIRVGGPAGDLVNAIGWSNMGGRCRGQVMLATAGERVVALKGVGVQGHSAQYLAILAQCRVAANSPIILNPRKFTVADLIEEEKLSCRSRTELTFALIGLAHYLPTDATWKSRDGRQWSLPRLVEEEIEQPIRGAPCGGTHRLFGLAYGCQRRLRATGQLDGVYLRADKYVRDYQNFTLSKLQNRDGSFSTEWFKYPADRRDDIDRKIQTTGHILEWLVSSLDQEMLYDPRVVAAAEFLSAALQKEPSREWKLGPLGHALHALNIYQERAWGVVLPGGIAAFHGPMKATNDPKMIAERPEGGRDRPLRR